MDLEYLNGVPDTSNYKVGDSQDFMGLMGEREALAELGKIFKRKSASGGGGSAPKRKGLFNKKSSAEGGGKKKGKVKEFLKKGLHVANRLNPAAATLRAGILAAMKLNFMKIGGQIRYSYLTDDQAKQKGLLMDRFAKMKRIREKLEKIFYGAGGKPENLKKAILTGRGNRDKQVPMNGLGYISYENVDGLNEDMPLSQLIGSEMYADEMHGVHGLGELGEPATAATIAAATTVLTTIAALIKSVGSLVPKKKGEAGGGDSGGGGDAGGGDGGDGGDSGGGDSGGDSSSDSGSSNDSGSDSSSDSGSDEGTNGSTSTKTPATTKKNTPATNDDGGDDGGDEDGGDSGGSQKKSAAKTSGGDNTTKPSFWENNKKWIKPVGIGVGSLGLLALIYHLLKPKPKPVHGIPTKRKPRKKNPSILDGLNGSGKKGGHHKRKSKPKGKKKVVTLL